jgi:hypothetical protein
MYIVVVPAAHTPVEYDEGPAGFGRDRYDAPQWAHDHEVQWLFGMGAIAMTARRIVHETGLYDEVLDEARKLGLLTRPSLSNPTPGPTASSLSSARLARGITPAPVPALAS